MKSIIYVGMDVHTTNFTLCCYRFGIDDVFAFAQVAPDYNNILIYLEKVKQNYGEDHQFLCGYEAGCLGYTLFHQLTAHGVNCVILAPTSMPLMKKPAIKTDRRDAAKIAKCLANGDFSAVYIPSDEDNSVKEYIRMRDDAKTALKRVKQQLLSFCTRNGKMFTDGSSYWTQKHLAWLKKLDFGNSVMQETFQEILASYFYSVDKVERYDRRIEELAQMESYREKVKKLSCLIGVGTITAIATIVETGDFKRFPTAQHYSAYLGLVPGEESSGKHVQRTGITKAGNSHLRKLLIESAQCYGRGAVGQKSKMLAKRQSGNEPQVITYADKANERLRRKFYRITFRSKRNIAVSAVARELSCFIWGMMTGNITQPIE